MTGPRRRPRQNSPMGEHDPTIEPTALEELARLRAERSAPAGSPAQAKAGRAAAGGSGGPGGRSSRPTEAWLSRRRVWLASITVLAITVAVVIMTSSGKDAGPREGDGRAFIGGDLHSLAADPNDPTRLFVGGHEAVSVSTDGGRTWTAVGSLEDADAMGWAFAPSAIWVSGHPGLKRSIDGGRTFSAVNEGLPNTDVHAFGAGRSVLYGASPAAGVFASTDGGSSWVIRTAAAGQGFFGRILVDPADDSRLIAADARSGPVESTDGGRSWRPLGGVKKATWVSWMGPGTSKLVASGPTGAAASADGGATWDQLVLPVGATLVEATAADHRLLYAAGLEGGLATVWVSRDGGSRWSHP